MANVVFRRLAANVTRPSTNTQLFTFSPGVSTRRCGYITFSSKLNSVHDRNYEPRQRTLDQFTQPRCGIKWNSLNPNHPLNPSAVQTRHFSAQSESKLKEHEHEQNRSDAEKTETEKEDAVKAEEGADAEEIMDIDSEELQKMSIWQRYKILLKQYGKVMIPVHLVTSTVWYSTFYFTVTHSGFDMVPIIEKFLTHLGVGESIIATINTPTASGLLIAYAMYKIATPARYTVTLGGTTYMVRYLRNKGHMAAAPPKDQTFREGLKESMSDMRERSRKTLEKRKQP